MAAPREDTRTETTIVTRHLRFGWWSLALFAAFGLILETLHGFKLGLYLDTSNETRRLMWTLAHAHGTLLSLIHLLFALTVRVLAIPASKLGHSPAALTSSTVLLPGGFFLGGVRFYAGDPGLGILLVPVGAALVIYAAVAVARAVGSASFGGKA